MEIDRKFRLISRQNTKYKHRNLSLCVFSDPPAILHFRKKDSSWNFIATEWDIPILLSRIEKYVLSIEINSKNQSYDVPRLRHEHRFEGLQEGTEYAMYVKAVNGEIQGPSTRITESTTSLGNF